MKRVIVESPYAGDISRNEHYARLCMHDCLMRNEAPYASHLLYTQPNVLNDTIPEQRELGMRAGFRWYQCADLVVVYTNLGISPGMKEGIRYAQMYGLPVTYRSLDNYPPTL